MPLADAQQGVAGLADPANTGRIEREAEIGRGRDAGNVYSAAGGDALGRVVHRVTAQRVI